MLGIDIQEKYIAQGIFVGKKIHFKDQVLAAGTKQSRQARLPCWPVYFAFVPAY